jgi:DNA-binding MarR family transcriptional regulator
MKGEKRALRLMAKTLAELQASSAVFNQIEEVAAEEGGQSLARWQVINVAANGQRTVSDIARRLGLTRQSVQRIAHVLVANKLATLAPNPDRQNSPHLQLTLAGAQSYARIAHSVERRLARIAGKVDGTLLKCARRDLRAMRTAALESIEA